MASRSLASCSEQDAKDLTRVGSPTFVSTFIRNKVDAIDKSLKLSARIPGGRIGYKIHRVTASSFHMTHLLRLIPRWRDFDERQSAWFERICNIPLAVAPIIQARLPRSLAGLGLYALEYIATCAYVGSLVQSADLRAVKHRHAPTREAIFAKAQPLFETLQPSLSAAPDGVLKPCDPLLLSGFT